MALSLQEISDRFEIMDLLTDYCSAIDSSDLDILDEIFTPNAKIDYSAAGGPCGDPSTIKAFLEQNLGNLPRQHLLTNYKIRLDGDRAFVRSLCYNPLEVAKGDDKIQVAIWGIWYEDRLTRTAEGWRIVEKTTKPGFNWSLEAK